MNSSGVTIFYLHFIFNLDFPDAFQSVEKPLCQSGLSADPVKSAFPLLSTEYFFSFYLVSLVSDADAEVQMLSLS